MFTGNQELSRSDQFQFIILTWHQNSNSHTRSTLLPFNRQPDPLIYTLHWLTKCVSWKALIRYWSDIGISLLLLGCAEIHIAAVGAGEGEGGSPGEGGHHQGRVGATRGGWAPPAGGRDSVSTCDLWGRTNITRCNKKRGEVVPSWRFEVNKWSLLLQWVTSSFSNMLLMSVSLKFTGC